MSFVKLTTAAIDPSHAPPRTGRLAGLAPPFLIGDRYEGAPDGDGKLYLQIVPRPWGESTGSYRVKIAVK